MYCKNCNEYCKGCEEEQNKLNKRPISINHTMLAVFFAGLFSEILFHSNGKIDILRVLFFAIILIIVFCVGVWVTTPFFSKDDK